MFRGKPTLAISMMPAVIKQNEVIDSEGVRAGDVDVGGARYSTRYVRHLAADAPVRRFPTCHV